jgi:hypothetical protein
MIPVLILAANAAEIGCEVLKEAEDYKGLVWSVQPC